MTSDRAPVEGVTCYERDEVLCEDGVCLRTGCRIANQKAHEAPGQATTTPAEVWELKQRLEKAEWTLKNSGFRRCDIAACNCDSWHQVGGFYARFKEIQEVVEEAGYSTNGRILLDVVKEIVARPVPAPVGLEREEMRSSGKPTQNPDSRTWTAGIDVMRQYPFQDRQWHLHAIEFHHKDRIEAERLRDATLAALSPDHRTEPASAPIGQAEVKGE